MGTWHPLYEDFYSKLNYNDLANQLAALSVSQKSSIDAATKHYQPKGKSGGISGVGKTGLHFLGRVLDILDKPRNALMTGADESSNYLSHHSGGYSPVADIGHFVHGLGTGISGSTHTSGHKFLQDFSKTNPINTALPTTGIAGAISGFGADVAGDPLSYLGVGLVDKPGQVRKAVHHAEQAHAGPQMPPELAGEVADLTARVKEHKVDLSRQLGDIQNPTGHVVDKILETLPDTKAPVAKSTKLALPKHPGNFIEPDFVEPEYTGKWFKQFSTKPNHDHLTPMGHLELAKRFKEANSGSLAAKEQQFADLIDSKLGLQTTGKDAAQDTSGLITNSTTGERVSLAGRGWMDATPSERANLIKNAHSIDEHGAKTGLKFMYQGEKLTIPELWTKIVGKDVPISAALQGGLPGAKLDRAAVLKSMHYVESKGYRELVDKEINHHFDKIVPEAEAAHKKTIETWTKMASAEKKSTVTEAPVADGPGLDFKVKPVNANRMPMVHEKLDNTLNKIRSIDPKKTNLNEVDQRNLLNSIWTGLRKDNKVWSAKRDYSVTNSMLKEAELIARESGRSFTLRDGTPFSLADFLEAASPTPTEWDSLSKSLDALPKLFEKYPKAYASAVGKTALDEASKTAPLVEDTVKSAAEKIVEGTPVAEVKAEASALVKNTASEAGVSDNSAQAAATAVKHALPDPVVPPAITDKLSEASRVSHTSETVQAAIARVDKINKVIGIRYAGQPTKLYIPGSGPLANGLAKVAGNVPETFSRMFNNAYGDELLHDDNRMAMSKALNYAGERVTAYHAIFDGKSHEDIRIAWESARTDGSDELGNQIVQRLNSVFGDRLNGISGSVVTRAGLTKNEVNDFLKKEVKLYDAKFTDTLAHPIKGQVKTDKWSDTWRNWKIPPEKVPDVLHRVELAVEKATARAQFIDHVGYTFGTKASEAPTSFIAVNEAYGRLRGLKFAPEIAPQLEKSLKEWTRTRDLGLQSPLVRQYDWLLSKWKTGMTIYSPSHHIRNAIGDLYLANLAGVKGVKHYKLAMKVMAKNHDKYKDADIALFAGSGMDLKLFENGDALKRAIANPRTDTVFTWKGKNVTQEQIYAGFNDMGLRQNVAATEQLGEVTSTAGPIKKVGYQVRAVSEWREDVIRMGHFIYKIQHSKAATLEEAMRDSAKEVRKYHFDYGDLTDFEQKVMKRIVPFYTWTRKSTPLLLRHLFLDPGKVTLYPKTQFAISDATGHDPQSIAAPYSAETEAMLPGWLKGTGFAPFGSHGSNLLTENISTPMNDMLTQFGNGPGAQLSNITPFAKIPIELATNKNLFTGKPLYDKSQYLDQQIPGVNQIGGMTNTSPVAGSIESAYNLGPGGGPTDAWKSYKYNSSVGGPANIQKILNYLLGSGQEVTLK